MTRLITLATLATLFIACGGADAPVAPSSAISDIALELGIAAPVQALYTGRATAVDDTKGDVNTQLCDVRIKGPAGRLEDSPANATISGVLTASGLYCITTGFNNSKMISEATVHNFSLTVGGNTITADRMHGMASAECPPGAAPRHSGKVIVTNLKINGTPAALRDHDRQNQTFRLPNGYIVFNEHSSFTTQWHAGRTVTGLRVVIESPSEAARVVVLSRSLAHIDCPPAP